MKQSIILALSAPLLAFAKPMAHQHLHKRDAVTTTIWEETTTTIDVTVTVYGPPPPGQIQLEGDVKDTPKDNDARPTPDFHINVEDKGKANEHNFAVVPKPTPPAEKAKVQPPQQPPQQPQPPAQPQNVQPPVQQKYTPPQGHLDDHKGNDHQGGGHSGGGAPTGGACGEMMGKCMASDVTIYDDQGIGACGWQNDTHSEDYFALSKDQWDGFTNDAPGPHKNKWCGRMATISVGEKTFEGMVTDKCPGCSGWSIDLSKSLWDKIFHEPNTRKHDVEWWFSGPQIFHGAGA